MAAEPALGVSFPCRDPASSTDLWQVGQGAAPTTPFCPGLPRFVCGSLCVWHLLEQRTSHDRDRNFGSKTKNLGREALPTGVPAQPATWKSINQTHM